MEALQIGLDHDNTERGEYLVLPGASTNPDPRIGEE